MILSLDDYINREVDPTSPFTVVGGGDALLAAALLDPGAQVPDGLQDEIVREQTANALRLQQQLVFRMGSKIGVLESSVPQVRNALRLVPPLVQDAIHEVEQLIIEAASTAIGVASDSLGMVPIIGWIVKAALGGANLALKLIAAMEAPGQRIGPAMLLAQTYTADADEQRVNDHLLPFASTADWTGIFMPSMRGELAAQIRNDGADRIVIAWGLRDDGIVPRVVIDKKPVFSPYTWHFSEEAGGAFTPAGGMGAVPGTARVVSVVQSTILEPTVIHRGHESLGDPRCGSSKKTVDVDVGTFYPSTANGAWSLFGYCTKAGAPAYTLATQEIVNAWQAYVDAIWEGIEKLWRNEKWESGWGCGPWQNALAGLARAHCVGMGGQVGGFGAWEPRRYETKLKAADRNAWEANNLCTKIVKPAMQDLREMQLALLRRTPMAAYLPATGLGSMRDETVKHAFGKAREALMRRTGGMKRRNRELRLGDVVDPWYREQLEGAGVGSIDGSGGIELGDYKPPRMAVPSSGGGRAAIALGVGAVTLAALGIAIRRRRRR